MFDPASRFRLVQEATMQPAVCLITKTDKGPFVDTNMELNKFDPIWSEVNMARIYLSVDVVREMAEGAGLFDEVRERAITNSVAEYERGHNEGVIEGGHLTAAADRLAAGLARLGHGSRVSESILPQGDAGTDPLILVTDGNERRVVGKGVDGTEREHGAPARQGNGAGSKRRAARVPSDSGDGVNPFRI